VKILSKIRFIVITSVGLFLVLSGCNDYRVEFIQVAKDNKKITVETCKSIISSIEDSIESATEEDKESLESLKERLEYMKKASILIDRYSRDQFLDKEVFVELIRLRIRILRGEKL